MYRAEALVEVNDSTLKNWEHVTLKNGSEDHIRRYQLEVIGMWTCFCECVTESRGQRTNSCASWPGQEIPSKSVCDLPDNVHSLIDDFWLVNCYDLFGPWPGSEHGQYSCPTAHIEHHLQVRRSNSLRACFISLMKGCVLLMGLELFKKIKSIASRKLIWLKRKVVSDCFSFHIYVLHHLIGNEHSSGFLWHVNNTSGFECLYFWFS